MLSDKVDALSAFPGHAGTKGLLLVDRGRGRMTCKRLLGEDGVAQKRRYRLEQREREAALPV